MRFPLAQQAIVVCGVVALLLGADAVTHAGDDDVRVIVVLRDPEGAILGRSRSTLRKRQDDVEAAFTSTELHVRRRYARVPALAATVHRDAYARLLARPEVARVLLDREVHTALAEGRALIHADAATAAGWEGTGIAVAVVDTGIDYRNQNLGGCFGEGCRVAGGADFVNDDDDPMDDNGHGTAVGGIIGAGDPAKRVIGIAPGVTLYALKVLDANGNGFDSNILAALDWVLDHPELGIRVVNMSLGDGGSYDDASLCDGPLATAIADLGRMSPPVAVVVASGNQGYATGINYPACVSDAIAVGAVYDADLGPRSYTVCQDPTTAPGMVTCYSNFSRQIAVVAPSTDCRTTGRGPDGIFEHFGGTSAATPYVSGALAIAMQANAGCPQTLASLRHLLRESAEVFPADPESGLSFPLVDVGNLVLPDRDGDGVPRDGDGSASGCDHPCRAGQAAGCDDNCPATANPLQDDGDGDGVGEACDDCPGVADPEQRDADRDGIGDACDPCTDTDGDGFGDPGPADVCPPDDCPFAPDPTQADGDRDGVGDACDLCPMMPSADRNDLDRDGVGDPCDNCPAVANVCQDDGDGKRPGDACDDLPFALEARPLPRPKGIFDGATYQRGTAIDQRGKLVIPDWAGHLYCGTGNMRALDAEGNHPALDASGRWLAVETPSGGGRTDITLCRLNGCTLRARACDTPVKLPDNGACTKQFPRLSNDAKKMVFTSNCTPDHGWEVFLYERASDRVTQLTSNAGAGTAYGPSIDQAGRFVVFDAGAELETAAGPTCSPGAIYVYDTERGVILKRLPHCTTCTSSDAPVVSGDGNTVVYYSVEFRKFHLMVADLRSGTARSFAKPVLETNDLGLVFLLASGPPAISFDGSRIAYLSGAAYDPARGDPLLRVFVTDLADGRTRYAKFCGNTLPGAVVLSGNGRVAAFPGAADRRCGALKDGPGLFRVSVR